MTLLAPKPEDVSEFYALLKHTFICYRESTEHKYCISIAMEKENSYPLIQFMRKTKNATELLTLF